MKASTASGAAEIDEREDVALRHEIAEPAGGERADDVEQPDHGDGPAADLDRQTLVHQIGRHVHGDECELEAAGEEAEHEQHVGAMTDRLRQRLPQRLGRHAMHRSCLRRAPSRSQATAAAPAACPRRRPRSAVCQPNASISETRERRIEKLAERARRRAGAEGQRTPARRQQLAESAEHDRERTAGEAEADEHAGPEIEHPGRGRIRHQDRARWHRTRRRRTARAWCRSDRQSRRRKADRHPTGCSVWPAPTRTRRDPNRCPGTSA